MSWRGRKLAAAVLSVGSGCSLQPACGPCKPQQSLQQRQQASQQAHKQASTRTTRPATSSPQLGTRWACKAEYRLYFLERAVQC